MAVRRCCSWSGYVVGRLQMCWTRSREGLSCCGFIVVHVCACVHMCVHVHMCACVRACPCSSACACACVCARLRLFAFVYPFFFLFIFSWDLQSLFQQLANALAFVHARNACHLNILPATVLLRDSTHVVLTGFEVTCADAARRSSCEYTAPEITPESCGSLACQASDVWSLGMLLLRAAMGPLNKGVPVLLLPHQKAIAIEQLPLWCADEADKPTVERMCALAGRILRRTPSEVRACTHMQHIHHSHTLIHTHTHKTLTREQ